MAYYESDDVALCSNFNQVLRIDCSLSDSRYMFYQLCWLRERGAFAPLSRKTTGLQNLQMSKFGDLQVKCPAKLVQRARAESLYQIQQLVRDGKALINRLDDLVKSQFVEMFGDPVEVIDAIPLGSIALLKAGNATTAASISETDADGLYPCYGGNGLRGYAAEFTHEGVFPLIGRQGAQCGNVKLASGKFRATEHAVVVQPTIEIDPIWLFHYLRYDDLGRLATGAAQPGLSVKNLNQIPVSIPPIALQQQFADFVARVDKLGFGCCRMTTYCDTLFSSVSARLLRT